MVNVDIPEMLFLGAAMAGLVGISLAHLVAVARLRTQPLSRCPVCRGHVTRLTTDCPACGEPL
jgi:hypothetical protein